MDGCTAASREVKIEDGAAAGTVAEEEELMVGRGGEDAPPVPCRLVLLWCREGLFSSPRLVLECGGVAARGVTTRNGGHSHTGGFPPSVAADTAAVGSAADGPCALGLVSSRSGC